MAKQVVNTNSAPAAVGPYSQGVVANGFVFCSGQIPLDPASAELVEGSIGDQTRRCMQSLGAVLEEAGSTLDQIVKVTVYLADISDYGDFNDAYAEFVGPNPPARAAFAVKDLPKGARIEIECIALAGA